MKQSDKINGTVKRHLWLSQGGIPNPNRALWPKSATIFEIAAWGIEELAPCGCLWILLHICVASGFHSFAIFHFFIKSMPYFVAVGAGVLAGCTAFKWSQRMMTLPRLSASLSLCLWTGKYGQCLLWRTAGACYFDVFESLCTSVLFVDASDATAGHNFAIRDLISQHPGIRTFCVLF